ncbi:MAG: MFS transporter [Pseudomonadota bacterium]
MTTRSVSSGRTIVTLLVGAALLLTGGALFQTLLPLRAGIEDFSPTAIGMLGAAYFSGFIVGCMVGPALVRTIGHIRTFCGIVALAAALALMFPDWPIMALWIGLRFLSGIALALAFMVIESWLNDQSENANRGRILSIYIIVANVATMAGQLLINIADTAGSALFMLVTVLYCLAIIPIALTPTNEPTPIPTAKLDLKELIAVSPVGTIGCFLVGIVEGAFWTLGPVFGQQRGMDVFEVTLLMTAFVLGGTLSQWPLGKLSDAYDRRLVMAPVAACTVVTGILIALWPLESLWAVLALSALHGALMIPLYALCLAHANDKVTTDKLVQTSGGLLLIYSVGAVIGPAAAALAMERLEAGGLFLFISAVLAVLALFILYRLIFGPVRDRLFHGPFTPMPKTSQSLFEMEVDDDPNRQR